MKLKHIELTNFRCFKEVKIQLHPKLTLFVGNNGAGKSAILDGIAIGLAPILSYLPELAGYGFKDSDFRKDDWKRAPYMRVMVQTLDGIAWDRTEKRDKSARSAKEIPVGLALKQLKSFTDSLIDAVNEETSVKFPVIAYYGTSRAVLEIPIRKRGFEKEFTRYGALAHALEATARFKTVFAWFHAMEDDERRLKVEQRNFDYRLPALETVRRAITKMIPGFSNPRIEKQPLHFMVNWQRGDKTETLMLEQLSDGYRTMLAMVMDLARRMAQANPHREDPLQSEAIVLIDEVDLHLHASWQQTILPDLLRVFPNAQFIVTTHSPQVLTTVEPEQIQILDWQDNQPFLKMPLSSFGAESWRILRDILGVNPRPDNEMSRNLNEYLKLIDSEKWNSSEADKLRKS
jgi:predicted ATP-binding protein involved in virulence